MKTPVQEASEVAGQRVPPLQTGEGDRLRKEKLAPEFWTLYASSLMVDLGLCLYFFMFNLFLVEHQFSEQSIGFITAAFTVGTLAGTMPASVLARRFGLRTMLLVYAGAAPICLAMRTLLLQVSAQILLAFIAGGAISIWSVCFSPTLAKLTSPANRSFGFSLFVATGIGSGALAGIIGGYLPGLVHHVNPANRSMDGIQVVLLLACGFIGAAGLAIMRLRFRVEKSESPGGRVFTGFLIRFMATTVVWNFSLSFFAPFANVYLSRHLALPITRIGAVFTLSQLIQVVTVLLAPILYRRVGLIAGIAMTQMFTALMLLGLSRATGLSSAIPIYLALTAVQWMGGPGLSALLMNRTPEEQRSHAAAMQNIATLMAQAGSAAIAGRIFSLYGYSSPLAANGALAAVAASLLFILFRKENREDCLPRRKLAMKI
jgi:MFS family permease